MEIRFAQQQDIAPLLRLLKQVGAIHAAGRPDLFRQDALKYDEEALRNLLREKDRPIIVAVEAGKVLGYAFCVRKETANDSVLADDVSLYIDDLCVDEACRGQGVGTRLYEAALDLAKRWRAKRVTLNVWAFNAPALAFYEKCGMKMQRIFMETTLEDTPW